MIEPLTQDYLLGHDLGLCLSRGERRVLTSLFLLHRKLDALETADERLTAATTALGTQLKNFEADITTGLASVVAALKNTPQEDPAIDAAVTALNAMGVGITGTQDAFDAAVASAIPTANVPTPSVPIAPPESPVPAPTTIADVLATTEVPTAAPLPQSTLDAMEQNARRAPEQSQ